MAKPRRIRTQEVLRYLGHTGQEMDAELAARIDAGVARCEAELDPRWTWHAFGLVDRGSVAAGARFAAAGTTLGLGGASMERYLEGACGVALMACTLGAASERTLRTLGATDPLAQLVYDAACCDLVEWGCDACEAEIVAWAHERGMRCARRFSPGYGDLGLEVQPVLLDVLQAGKRLGLTCSDANLLVPTKSVTALVGLFDDPPPNGEACGCSACGIRAHCRLRARGLTCRSPHTAG